MHGTDRLRVVDASVFPRIPGFFVVLPTYMVSEKASDVILRSARERGTTTPAHHSATHHQQGARMSTYRRSGFWRTYVKVAEYVDHRRGWHRLPRPLGLAVLVGVRTKLRQQNLARHPDAADPGRARSRRPPDPLRRTQRTPDGSWNDLDDPAMGMAGHPVRAQHPARGDPAGSPRPTC